MRTCRFCILSFYTYVLAFTHANARVPQEWSLLHNRNARHSRAMCWYESTWKIQGAVCSHSDIPSTPAGGHHMCGAAVWLLTHVWVTDSHCANRLHLYIYIYTSISLDTYIAPYTHSFDNQPRKLPPVEAITQFIFAPATNPRTDPFWGFGGSSWVKRNARFRCFSIYMALLQPMV